MYTLADLTRLSGAKRRTVQLWAEGGVLLAEPTTERQGSGVHRTFSRDEAIICLIIARFARWNISIGQLLRIAAGLRKDLLPISDFREKIERCIKGEETIRMSLDSANTIRLIGGINDDKMLASLLRDLGKTNETMIVFCLDGALATLRAEPKA